MSAHPKIRSSRREEALISFKGSLSPQNLSFLTPAGRRGVLRRGLESYVREVLLVAALVATFGLCACYVRAAEPLRPKESPATATTNRVVQLIELRGRVVCLPEEMHRRHQAELPTRHEHVWGFKATNGVCYTLLRGRFSEAIWLDERIRARELQVRARLFPRTQILELQNVKSVRNGVVQDLYYFCDVCIIQSVSPEVCACCQGPVVLVEKPLKEKGE